MADIVVTISGKDENLERLIHKLVGSLNQLNAAGAKTSASVVAAAQRQADAAANYGRAVQNQINQLRGLAIEAGRAAEQEARLPQLRERISKSIATAERAAAKEALRQKIEDEKKAADITLAHARAIAEDKKRTRALETQQAFAELSIQRRERQLGLDHARAIAEDQRRTRNQARIHAAAIAEDERRTRTQGLAQARAIAEEERRTRALGVAHARALADEQRRNSRSLAREAGIVAGVTASITTAALRLASLAVDKIVDGLTSAVQLGLQFNATIESAAVGMAAIIGTQNDLIDAQGRVLQGQEKFNASLGIAQGLIEQLRIKAAGFGLPFTETLEGLAVIQGPLTRAGLTLEQIVDLAPKLALGLRAAGVPLREIGQETRAILNGTQTRNDRLNQILGVTKKEVDEARKLDKVYELLNGKLQEFTASGIAQANTYRAIFERLAAAGSVLTGRITEPLFESVKRAGQTLIGGILDTETGRIQPQLNELVTFAQGIFARIGGFVERMAQGLVRGLQDVSKWLEDNGYWVQNMVDLFGIILGQVGQLISLVAQLTGGLTQAAGEAGAFSQTLSTTAKLLFALQFGFKTILAILHFIGAALVQAFVKPIAAVLQITGKAAQFFGADWGKSVEQLGNRMDRFADNTLDKNIMLWGDLAEEVDNFNKSIKDANSPFNDVRGGASSSVDPKSADVTVRAKEIADEEDGLKKRKDLVSDYFKERFAIQTEFLREAGQLEEAQLRDLQVRYRDFVATAVKIGDFAGVLLANGLINVQQMKLRIEQAEREVGRLGSRLGDTLGLLDAKQGVGRISPEQAGAEATRAIRETQAGYRELIRTMEEALEVQRQAAAVSGIAFDSRESEDKIRRLRNEIELLDIEIRKMELERFRQDIDRLGSGLSETLNQLAAQRSAGRITPRFAEEEARRAIRETQAEYRKLIEAMEKALAAEQALAEASGEAFDSRDSEEMIRKVRNEVELLDIELQKLGDAFFGLRDALQGPVEQAFNSFFDNIISRNRSIVQSFGDLAKGIINAIARTIREMLVAMAVKKLLDAAFSSGPLAGGGLLGSLASAAGSVASGGTGGVGEWAEGTARIEGPGTSTSDSIPAWLSRGESVIPTRAAKFYGYDFMDALIGMRVSPNMARMAMRAPGFANGASRVQPAGSFTGAGMRPGGHDRLDIGLTLDPGLLVDRMSGREGERWFLDMAARHPRALAKMQPRTGR